MSALELWRKEIRPLIARGFLRRDQGEGLFISDFPRFEGAEMICASLEKAGFSVEIQSAIARIDGTEEKYLALQKQLKRPDAPPDDANLPLFSLADRLAKKDIPFRDQPLPWIHFTLKCLDEKKNEDILRLLSPGIALLQRQHAPLPTLAGALILDDLFHRMKGAETEC